MQPLGGDASVNVLSIFSLAFLLSDASPHTVAYEKQTLVCKTSNSEQIIMVEIEPLPLIPWIVKVTIDGNFVPIDDWHASDAQYRFYFRYAKLTINRMNGEFIFETGNRAFRGECSEGKRRF